MLFVFHRRLAIPLWAVAFFMVAFTTPPTAATRFLASPATVFAIAAVGIAAIIFLVPGAITRLRASRSLVRVVPSEYPNPACARIVVAASIGVRKLYESDATEAGDALDLIRMDDDGGWQMPRSRA
jgi:hypothetical protein